jgi:hypothetical protein
MRQPMRNQNGATIPSVCNEGLNCDWPHCTCDLDDMERTAQSERRLQLEADVREMYPNIRGEDLNATVTALLEHEDKSGGEIDISPNDLEAEDRQLERDLEEYINFPDHNGRAHEARGIDNPPPKEIIDIYPDKDGATSFVGQGVVVAGKKPHELGDSLQRAKLTADVWDKLSKTEQAAFDGVHDSAGALQDAVIAYFFQHRGSFNNRVIVPWEIGTPSATVTTPPTPDLSGVPMRCRGSSAERKAFADTVWLILSTAEKEKLENAKTAVSMESRTINYFFDNPGKFPETVRAPWDNSAPGFSAKPAAPAKPLRKQGTDKERSVFAKEVWGQLWEKEIEELEKEHQLTGELIDDIVIDFYYENRKSFTIAGPPWDPNKGSVTHYKACHTGPHKVYSVNKCNVYAAAAKEVHLFNGDWDLRIICDGPRPDLTVANSPRAKALLGSAGEDCETTPWVWIDWPDYGVPKLTKHYWHDLANALEDFEGNVCVNCMGGHGRTGTAIAILASLHSVVPDGDCPVEWLRSVYCRQTVESDAQLKYIAIVTGRNVASDTRDKQYKNPVQQPSMFGSVPTYLKPAPKEAAPPGFTNSSLPAITKPSVAEALAKAKPKAKQKPAPQYQLTPEQQAKIKAEREKRKLEKKLKKQAIREAKPNRKGKGARRGLGSY